MPSTNKETNIENRSIPVQSLVRQLTEYKWDMAKEFMSNKIATDKMVTVAVHYGINGQNTYHMIHSDGSRITLTSQDELNQYTYEPDDCVSSVDYSYYHDRDHCPIQ